jgi:hypothetical protein
MPRICEFLGIYIYMYYDDHSPPHFHAIYGQYEAEILIAGGEILKGVLPQRTQSLVKEWATLYIAELQDNWDRARNHEPLRVIPALE